MDGLDVLESTARGAIKDRNGKEKEVGCVCCMIEVVLPTVLKQEARCMLEKNINICGV